ncbi:YIP1 family protein [Halobellus marinus]|uniref:YIP1 family protein n=1 Tax=Halobellus TaxID=1073986 RepID=UPI0028A82A93|nr:YIP1 family protein [Halobellus sp. DFY28]
MPPSTPLLRPDRFFAERDTAAGRILLVFCLLVFSLPLGIWGVGQVLKLRIDGTVLVENPNRPSERFCEGAPASMDVGCDAPAQIEQNIDTVLSEAIGQLIGPALLGTLIVIVVVGGLLHFGSWVLGGENGVAASFAVALWGLVPSVVSLLFGLGLLFVLVDPMTVTPASDPAVVTAQLQTDLTPLQQWSPLITGITTLWSAIIWRFGLQHIRGLSSGAATGVAGSVAVLLWLGSFV